MSRQTSISKPMYSLPDVEGFVSLSELALAGLGLGLAALSVGFAGYMAALGDHQPRVNGMQYLAIFAQPRGAGGTSETPARRPTTAAAVDPTATGSIAPRPPRTATANEPAEIVTADRTKAWIKIEGTIRAAAPGDTLPGLGRIAAIVERDGRWIALDDAGKELVAGAKAQGNGTAALFRPLIFDPGAK